MTLTIVERTEPGEIAAYDVPDTWPLLTAAQVEQHAPDMSLVCLAEESVVARCSLWWTATPTLESQHVGAIGHYAALNSEAASMLLNAACDILQRHGCAVAVGPMDGNTWRSYRLVVDVGTEPPFFMEPTNPPSYPGHFESTSFAPLADYMSSLNTDLTVRDPRVNELAERFASRGITVRALRMADFEQELRHIFCVSEAAFAKNFLYTPLPEGQFIAQYMASKPVVVPELVTIAEHEGAVVGYCFALPDMLEKARGEAVRTVILKTVAILPERSLYAGLGALMIDRTHMLAHDMGFTRVIHALMHDTNQSRAISARTGSVMRRYVLYSRRLVQ